MKKLIRGKHDNGKGQVWYILDTETGCKRNTYYSADNSDGFRKRHILKLFKEELK